MFHHGHFHSAKKFNDAGIKACANILSGMFVWSDLEMTLLLIFPSVKSMKYFGKYYYR